MSRISFSKRNTLPVWLLGLFAVFGTFLLIRNLKKNVPVSVPRTAPPGLIKSLRICLGKWDYSLDLVPYIIALSAMESGRWTAPLYTRYNNPWGMRNPVQRETSSIGSTPGGNGAPEGFAIYFDDLYACRDFMYYLDAKRSPKNFDRFYDFISFIQSKGYEPGLSTFEYYTRCLNAVT